MVVPLDFILCCLLCYHDTAAKNYSSLLSRFAAAAVGSNRIAFISRLVTAYYFRETTISFLYINIYFFWQGVDGLELLR